MAISNSEARDDELVAISSIFEDQFVLEDKTSGLFYASPVIANPPLIIENYEEPFRSIKVNYLPPLEFRFELPDGYPSTEPPIFSISSDWLDLDHLSSICHHLDELWSSTKGEILFIWFDFLINDLLEFIGIDKMVIKQKQIYNETELDPRAKTLLIDVNPFIRIENYDIAKKKAELELSQFDCQICFSRFFGSDCFSFNCEHYFCNACMTKYIESCITDGRVQKIPCPADQCDATADQRIVKELVGPELFSKYDSLLFSTAIYKQNVIYCPRTSCLKPIINTGINPESEKSAILCPYCSFAFCSLCRATYHGVSPCQDFANEEEKERVLNEYETGSTEDKNKLEKRYGKRFLTKQLNEHKNNLWLNSKAKKCPHCSFFIEKNEGCNKIHCLKCGKFFCWLCLTKLKDTNPYLHFQSRKSPCYYKLFEGVEDLEDLEDVEDDEDDE